MAITEKEAMASFRMLVCMARADGKLAAEERETLESALSAIPLPAGTTLNALLDEDAHLDALLKQIESAEARAQAYQAAYSIANVDGHCSPEEMKVLERIKATLAIPEEEVSLTQRLFGEAKDTLLPSSVQAVTDPAKRTKEVNEDILKYSVMNAVLGAFPIPLVDIAVNLASIAVQLKMIRDIGLYYGHNITKETAKSLVVGVGASAGARIAVISLCKFVPGWGSVVGAAANFATTYALGRVADKWFAGGCKDDFSALKAAFKSAEKEGKQQYEVNKDRVEFQKRENEAQLKEWAAQLKEGKITQAEYERNVEALARR